MNVDDWCSIILMLCGIVLAVAIGQTVLGL